MQGWLGVYNAAGERVRRLYSGGLERSPNGLNADAGSLIPGGLLGLSFGARLPDGSSVLTWDGTNDAGQTLDGGIYTVRLESEDPFGQKASYSVAVQVLAAPTGARLSVYNSAGELVSRQVLPAAQARASGFELDKGLLAPEEALQGQFLLPSGAVNGVIWDGRGADGAPVASGIYTLILEQDGGRALQMRSVQVLKGPEPAAPLVLAGPSPLRGRALSVAAGAATGRRVAAELFNLAGERVAFDAALDGSGRVQLDCAALASGVYLVFVQVEDPGQRYPRRVLRVAIVH